MRAPQNSIFICYRRDDSADIVGRIYDRLVGEFGKKAIYRDVDAIPLGVDFRKHIQDCLKTCRIGLVIIGPDWSARIPGTDESRLNKEEDHVRIECETMIASPQIVTIPCFVRGVTSIDKGAVPESLKMMAFINGLQIRRDPDFHNDIEVLIRDVSTHLSKKAAPPERQPPKPKIEKPSSTTEAPKDKPIVTGKSRAKLLITLSLILIVSCIVAAISLWRPGGTSPSQQTAASTPTVSDTPVLSTPNPWLQAPTEDVLAARMEILQKKVDSDIRSASLQIGIPWADSRACL